MRLKMFRTFLFEDVALSKGCQRIYNNPKLVKSIAQTLKEEAEFHPSSFQPGIAKKIVKAPDERAAHWFLEQLDAIERQGYEGMVYSRDGADAEWIVKTFIDGSSNFEDIVGNLNMCLRDWYLLKNRNALEPQHKELSRFKSINQLGSVVTHHYANEIEEFKQKSANAAKQKSAKSALLVDNDDYKIYVPFNRIASCLLGDKAKWCTANTEYDSNFHSYAGRAMLFIVMPYYKDEETGKKTLVPQEVKITQGPRAGQTTRTNEKFQFDSGSGDFMDITNVNVNPAIIAERFPYLFSDIEQALKEKKPAIDAAIKAAEEDPALSKNKDTAVKTYDVDKELKALDRFMKKGHFTDKRRPKEKPPEEPAAEVPAEQPQQQLPAPAEPLAEVKSIKELANHMLDDELEEDDELVDAGAATGGSTGSMGGGAGPASGAKYAPGTAPTMPESLKLKGNSIMEKNVDKDVAAMIASLKKYDKLTESVAPVLGMRTLGEAGKPEWLEDAEKKAEKKEGKADKKEEVKEEEEKNPWRDLAKKEDKKGKVTKTATGLKHEKNYDAKEDKKDDEELDESASADQDVLTWMKRFANLGNMKGYGR